MIHLAVLACLTFFWSACSSAAADRIALIIGNASYENVSPLTNPTSDARLMAEALQQVGFKTTVLIDASQEEMKRGISQFGSDLRQAGRDATALFYYAGHAVQSFGNNYLLPVDSAIRHQADLDLYGVEADWVLRQLFAARVETNIVILDACRNNPFQNLNGFDNVGLAEMDAPPGSFIAYATAPGNVALDGTGSNSPYTSALASAILERPRAIEQVFKDVRVSVLQETGGRQTPWDASSLTADFSFVPYSSSQPGAGSSEANFWNSVKDSGDPAELQLFLRVHPQGVFKEEAEERLAALQERALTPFTPPPNQNQNQADPNLPLTPGGTGEIPLAPSGPITFTSPLTEGAPHIVGLSIQQIFSTASPLFPPLEGLPEELWKDKNCSNCHQWTKELLCEQGRFYLTDVGAPSLTKQHPLGGTFKENLRRWATDGCL